MNTPVCPNPYIKASVVLIDSTRAKAIIAKNTENQRTVKSTNLNKLISCMRGGRFVLNGESIVISNTGRLLNGQHRILAVIDTGVPIWTVLVEGIPDEYFATFDSGSIRMFSDALKISGDDHTHHLSTSVMRLCEYLHDAPMGEGKGYSHAELWGVRADHPGLLDSVRACSGGKLSQVIATSRCAWLHYLVKQQYDEKCTVFFEKLADGTLLESDSPIWQLRNRLMADRAAARKLSTREVLALLIKAWNYHLAGKPLRVLRWSAGERFPVLNSFPKN